MSTTANVVVSVFNWAACFLFGFLGGCGLIVWLFRKEFKAAILSCGGEPPPRPPEKPKRPHL